MYTVHLFWSYVPFQCGTGKMNRHTEICTKPHHFSKEQTSYLGLLHPVPKLFTQVGKKISPSDRQFSCAGGKYQGSSLGADIL